MKTIIQKGIVFDVVSISNSDNEIVSTLRIKGYAKTHLGINILNFNVFFYHSLQEAEVLAPSIVHLTSKEFELIREMTEVKA